MSPVNRLKAALGNMSLMALYMLCSSVNGTSQLWSPLGPAGNLVLPGPSVELKARQQVGLSHFVLEPSTYSGSMWMSE